MDNDSCVFITIVALVVFMIVVLVQSVSSPEARLNRRVQELRYQKNLVELKKEEAELHRYLDKEAKKTPEAE